MPVAGITKTKNLVDPLEMPSKPAISNITSPTNHSAKISPSDEILASPNQTKATNGHGTGVSRSKSIVPSVTPPSGATATVTGVGLTANNKASLSQHLWKDHPTIGRYKITRTLGRGNFAKVKLGEHLLTGQQVAIKVIDKTQLNDNSYNKMVREVDIMKMLNHPNIVRLYEVIESQRRVYLVMEYASNGEVFDYLVTNGRMKEKEARVKFRQLVSAVEYCHRKKIVHRDLKAENLLLDKDYNIKLADFGFSNFYDDGRKLDTYCGSPPYAAPELFQGQKYIGPEVDVWSLGVILYTLVSGTLPFDAQNLKELQSRVIRGKYRIPFYMSSECEHLLRKLLVLNPSKRKSLHTIMSDNWLNLGLEQATLEPYVEPAPDYHDPLRLSIMQKMGYPPDEVREALRNQACNNLTAIYLLLGNKETCQGIADGQAARTPSNTTSTSGADEEEASGPSEAGKEQNSSRKVDQSSKQKDSIAVESPRKDLPVTGETSEAKSGAGNQELRKPVTFSWMKHSSSAGPNPRTEVPPPNPDGPTVVLPRLQLPAGQWPVGNNTLDQPPSSLAIEPGSSAAGEDGGSGVMLRPAGSDADTCLPVLSPSNQPLARAVQFSDIPNLVTTGSPPTLRHDRSSTLEEASEPLVDRDPLQSIGITTYQPTTDGLQSKAPVPVVTKPAMVYRKPNAFLSWLRRTFSCHRRQEPRSSSFAQPPGNNSPIVRIDGEPDRRHVVDILNPESRHQFTRNCPDRATVLGLTPGRLRRPSNVPRQADQPRSSTDTSRGNTLSGTSNSEADTLYGSVTGGTGSKTGVGHGGAGSHCSDGTLNSGIVPQLQPTESETPATSERTNQPLATTSRLQWSMRFRPGVNKETGPTDDQTRRKSMQDSPPQATVASTTDAAPAGMSKHNSSGDLDPPRSSGRPERAHGGRFIRRLTMRIYRSVRRNRSCHNNRKSPTSQLHDATVQSMMNEEEETVEPPDEVSEGFQALSSDPWTAMLPGRLQLPATFSGYKLSSSSRGSTCPDRAVDGRKGSPTSTIETGADEGKRQPSAETATPSPSQPKVKPKLLPLVHRLPVIGRNPESLVEQITSVLEAFKIAHTQDLSSPFCYTCSATVTGKQLDERNNLSYHQDEEDATPGDEFKGLRQQKSLSVDLVSSKSPRFLKWEMEIFQLIRPLPRYGIRFKRVCGSRDAYRILERQIILCQITKSILIFTAILQDQHKWTALSECCWGSLRRPFSVNH